MSSMLLGNLLGGGTLVGGAGVTDPEDVTDSAWDSEVFGRDGGRSFCLKGCRGGKIALLRNVAAKFAIPPTRRPTIDAHARKMYSG